MSSNLNSGSNTNRKATLSGNLATIANCIISIPEAGDNGGVGTIPLNNLPDISDSKSAVYNSEAILGRSIPLYTYSHSADRQINLQLHFFIINDGDGAQNLQYLRMIQSAVYPRSGLVGSSSGTLTVNPAPAATSGTTPYLPPPVCTIQCGNLLATEALCVILQSYSVKFPTEVAWDAETYCPYRFDVDTSWLVVYTSSDLPFQDRIIQSGR